MRKLVYQAFVLTVIIFTQVIFAKDIILKGKVRNEETYTAVSDVNIYIENTNIGTTTKFDGTFILKIPDDYKDAFVVFEHIGYDVLKEYVSFVRVHKYFYLKPRPIESEDITVEAEKVPPEITKDLPQPISIIESKDFEIRGFSDAGDLLRTEQSILVNEDEEFGQKTISIRGGNADDVIVLYNGIKMNNIYDNVFDLSLINLEDIKQIEIIKGSHTSLYGSEAFSGVLNLVPKTYRDYTVKYLHKLGTYETNDWNVQTSHTFENRLNCSYSFKQGNNRKYFTDGSNFLKNTTYNHSGQLIYNLSPENEGSTDKSLSLMYLRSSLDFKNTRDIQTMNNLNQIFSLRYLGDIASVENINLSATYKWYDNKQNINPLYLEFINRSLDFNAEKKFEIDNHELLFVYQLEYSSLDFREKSNTFYLESAKFSRYKHGFASLYKYNIPLEEHSDFFTHAEFDVSYRFDMVSDNPDNLVFNPIVNFENRIGDNKWNKSTLKFSTRWLGEMDGTKLSIYFNYGDNIKFPSLFQQISSPSITNPDPNIAMPSLNPEENSSTEMSLSISRENYYSYISGWEINTNFFLNHYYNKFRIYDQLDSPILFYDNVRETNLDGFEVFAKLFFLSRKITVEFGSSRYITFDKFAFPGKFGMKNIINVYANYYGFSFHFAWYDESQQERYVPIHGQSGSFDLHPVDGHNNIDIHLSKDFKYENFKFFLNASIRNLLSDSANFNGISLYDRRYYLTLGAQYLL